MNEPTEKKPVISTRIDLRKLAAVAQFYASRRGAQTVNRSLLVSETFESVCDQLSIRGTITVPKTYEEAIQILAALGIEFQRGTQQHKTVVKLLQEEELENLFQEEETELKQIAMQWLKENQNELKRSAAEGDDSSDE